ncbi:dihydrodipicolinate synthase family protein [Paenibacillus sp. CC-CFT747]|nr:dihydrodipicolinate synthase family protein [Paenibacillus sp. CC-CFT747]
MLKPEGIIPAMVTPFTEDGSLNEPAVRQLIEHLLKAGVHGIFVLGTNGEFFSMTEEEKVELVRIAADAIGGRVPLYAGAGTITTAGTARLARKLEEAGADALSVITPYFVPVTQAEMKRHYEAVAASVENPILLYNIPSRTGVTLEVETVAALAVLPNVVGIKDSSGNFEYVLQLIHRTGPSFAVMAGTDSLILPTLLAGGTGAVAASANAAPIRW